MPEDTGNTEGTGSTAAFAGTAGSAAVEVAGVAELVASAVAAQTSEPRVVAVVAVAVTTAMLEPAPVVPGGLTAMIVAGETRVAVEFVSADRSALEDGLLLEHQRFARQILACP